MKKIHYFLIYCLWVAVIFSANKPLLAQSDSIALRDIAFFQHLTTIKDYQSAVSWADDMLTNSNYTPNIKDSVSFLNGYMLYSQKKLSESNRYLLQISPQSHTYQRARFLAGYNCAYSKDWQQSENIFNNIDTNDSLLIALKRLNTTGLSLLQRRTNEITDIPDNYNFFAISTEQKNMQRHAQAIRDYRPKSKMLAGFMSAIIPGAGKMYVGKLGEGSAALLMVGTIAAVTVENGIKAGWTNPKTLLFGGLFTIFYTGNIAGSYISAKRRNNEFNESVDNYILYDMHTAMRNVFE